MFLKNNALLNVVSWLLGIGSMAITGIMMNNDKEEIKKELKEELLNELK